MDPDATATALWRATGASLAFGLHAAAKLQAHLTPTGWLLLTGEPVANFNLVLVDAGPDPEGQLRTFGEVLHTHELPALVFLTVPVAERLAPVAAELGLQPAGQVPLMVYQPSAGREAGGSSSSAGAFRIEQATTPAALAEVNRLVANTFGVPLEVVERLFTPSILDTPGLALYLARDGEQAISTLLTTRASRAVGIWNMATVPERQRQGAGRALLTHALAHQQGQGAETFYLLATEAGLPLYEGVGFRILTMPAVWVNGHSDEAPAQ